MNRDASATGWNAEPFNADEDAPDLWNDAAKPSDGLPAFVAPDIDEELLDVDGPPDWMGIRWRDIDDTDRAEAWTVLRQWVDWFIREYSLTTTQIIPCWYEHADIVAELYAGMCAEYKVWDEGMPGLAPMTTWHPHVVAMKARLAEMVSNRTCAATKTHVPDPDDLPFTYDQDAWGRVRGGITTITELPRTGTNQWWRPATWTGAHKITGREILVGGHPGKISPEITDTTLLSGADATTAQARHTTFPGPETGSFWEYAPEKDSAHWTRHIPEDQSTAEAE